MRLFPMPDTIDVKEADEQLPAQYYRWPECLLTLRCVNCSFVWDCPFTFASISEVFTWEWEAREDGDDLCPVCQIRGEET